MSSKTRPILPFPCKMGEMRKREYPVSIFWTCLRYFVDKLLTPSVWDSTGVTREGGPVKCGDTSREEKSYPTWVFERRLVNSYRYHNPTVKILIQYFLTLKDRTIVWDNRSVENTKVTSFDGTPSSGSPFPDPLQRSVFGRSLIPGVSLSGTPWLRTVVGMPEPSPREGSVWKSTVVGSVV